MGMPCITAKMATVAEAAVAVGIFPCNQSKRIRRKATSSIRGMTTAPHTAASTEATGLMPIPSAILEDFCSVPKSHPITPVAAPPPSRVSGIHHRRCQSECVQGRNPSSRWDQPRRRQKPYHKMPNPLIAPPSETPRATQDRSPPENSPQAIPTIAAPANMAATLAAAHAICTPRTGG